MNLDVCRCGCGKVIKNKSTWARGHNPKPGKEHFDWSNLENDYIELKSTKKIAKKYGCSHEAVSYQMDKRGILVSDKVIKIDDIEELYKQYKSVYKIAELVGCSKATVEQRLHEIGHSFSHDNKGLDTELGLGRYGELIALHILKGSKDMNMSDIQGPYDIEWNDFKIDVKTSKIRVRENRKDSYSFSTRNGNCDFFFLISLDNESVPISFFLIPSREVKATSISFNSDFKTKWIKYKMEVRENDIREAIANANSIRCSY